MIDFQKKQWHGFTLIEVLIALFIYAIIIVIVSIALGNMLSSSNRSINDIVYFNKLQRAMLVLQRDLIQTVNRPIVDASGQLLPAFIFPSPEKPFLLSFSSHISNHWFPAPHTSDIQRIAYRYHNHILYRITWPVLDRVNQTYQEKAILDQIQQLSWRFIDHDRIYYNRWPPSTATESEPLPSAVLLTLSLDDGNQIEKLFVL